MGPPAKGGIANEPILAALARWQGSLVQGMCEALFVDDGRDEMSRTIFAIAAATAVVAGTSILPGAQALDKPGTITITDSEIRHAHIDLGRDGASAGDLDVYRMLLYNKRIQPQSLGHATMTCTAIGTQGQSCTATYVLPRGQIVAEGVISSRLIYALAVVGGTGLYGNVQGSLTVTSLRRKPVRELLVFRLVV
jgi:hypothetical protein